LSPQFSGGGDISRLIDVEQHLEIEREGLSACAGHPDGREELGAFVEKRNPVFPGPGRGSGDERGDI